MSLADRLTQDDGDPQEGNNEPGARPSPSGKNRLTPVAPIVPDAPEADVDVEVRPLRERRPVPPPARPRTGPPEALDRLPVYDPFTARRRQTPEWQVRYTTSLVIGDVIAVGLGVLASTAVLATESAPTPSQKVAALLLWPSLLAFLGAYAEWRQGAGVSEYRRVVDAGLISSAVLGVAASMLPGHGLGRLLVIGVPVTLLVTLTGRGLNRRRLNSARRKGLMTKRVVVVGPDAGVLDLTRRIRRDPTIGLRIVGACVPRPVTAAALAAENVPVIGSLAEAVHALDEARADAVLVVASDETSGQYLRDLTWRLEGTNIEVLLGPGMIEVSPSRLHVRPTASMPLIRIREPEFRGRRRVVKDVVDWLGALTALVVVAPLMLGIAVVIKATSKGPVLYRHRRIGKCGRPFDLLKFRSMTQDADRREALLMQFNECNEVQFKMRQDPRVTRVGRFLRRYSLDELPQLFNVLKGDMSLVGPRPHVTREVEHYGADMHRRLLVKPGITGLWQVSGRSDLGWEEAVELDVRYVENWSLGLDLIILGRTLRAIIRAAGAY